MMNMKENHEGLLPNGKLELTVESIGKTYLNEDIQSFVFAAPSGDKKWTLFKTHKLFFYLIPGYSKAVREIETLGGD